MSILTVLEYPNPLLLKPSKDVEEVNDEIRKMFDDMHETLTHHDAIGLASNQVGIDKRILVIDQSGINELAEYPLYIANPRIVEYSEEKCMMAEPCLSFPGVKAEIERSAEITLEYLDYHNTKRVLKTKGLLARCIMHEMDHVDGIVIFDRLSPLKKDLLLKKYAKYKKANAGRM